LGIWWSNKRRFANVRRQLKAQQNLWQLRIDWLRKALGSMNKGAGGRYRIYHLPHFYSEGLATDAGFFAFGQFIQHPYHNGFIPVV
jgi:hypothetical protein